MSGRRTLHTRCIVLDKTKLGEQDLILTLLAQDGEQRRAVAKGARRPGGKFASRCELFCETDLLLAHGRTLDVVSEAALVDPHERIRGDLPRVAAASALCEVASLTSFEDATDPFLYAILSRALGACEQASDQAHLDLVTAAYAFKVLARAGWRPELGSCILCGDQHPTFFSAAAGGAVCSSCARELAGAQEVGPATIAWLRTLLASTFDELLSCEADDGTAAVVLGLAHVWCATHLDARLRAWEFMRSM